MSGIGAAEIDFRAIGTLPGAGLVGGVTKWAVALAGFVKGRGVPVGGIDLCLVENGGEVFRFAVVSGLTPEVGKVAEIGVLMRSAGKQHERVPVLALFLNDEIGRPHGMPGEEGAIESLQAAFAFFIREQATVQAIKPDGGGDRKNLTKGNQNEDQGAPKKENVEVGQDDEVVQEDQQAESSQGLGGRGQ